MENIQTEQLVQLCFYGVSALITIIFAFVFRLKYKFIVMVAFVFISGLLSNLLKQFPFGNICILVFYAIYTVALIVFITVRLRNLLKETGTGLFEFIKMTVITKTKYVSKTDILVLLIIAIGIIAIFILQNK